MPILFEIKRNGKNFSAVADAAAEFPVGQKVRYKNKKSGTDFFGLSNDSGFFGHDYAEQFKYAPLDFDDNFDFLAYFIEPTSICEGQSFLSLNTYDRARFTFGFGQFAAHVPNGDFIRWFRDMLARPEAPEYFPNLLVKGKGDIYKVDAGGEALLADAASTTKLCEYFNPTLGDIEDSEVVAAAKFMHWTVQHQGARLLQVQHMVNTALRHVKHADSRLGLDGRTGDICCVVFDILHQGRGGFDDMLDAIKSPTPFESLLQVGKVGEPTRVANLARAMQTCRDRLKAKTWSRAKGDFI